MWQEDNFNMLEQYYTNNPAPTNTKKNFWQTGFGQGLSNIWGYFSTNPSEITQLVANRQQIKLSGTNPLLTDPNNAFLQYGNQNTNQPRQNDSGNGNSNVILIVLGVVVVVVLFFLFKNK